MFGLGIQEIIVIIIVILLLIDHKKIPEFTRGVGKIYREFRRAQESLRDELLREEVKLDSSESEKDLLQGESKEDKDYKNGGGEYDGTGRAG